MSLPYTHFDVGGLRRPKGLPHSDGPDSPALGRDLIKPVIVGGLAAAWWASAWRPSGSVSLVLTATALIVCLCLALDLIFTPVMLRAIYRNAFARLDSGERFVPCWPPAVPRDGANYPPPEFFAALGYNAETGAINERPRPISMAPAHNFERQPFTPPILRPPIVVKHKPVPTAPPSPTVDATIRPTAPVPVAALPDVSALIEALKPVPSSPPPAGAPVATAGGTVANSTAAPCTSAANPILSGRVTQSPVDMLPTPEEVRDALSLLFGRSYESLYADACDPSFGSSPQDLHAMGEQWVWQLKQFEHGVGPPVRTPEGFPARGEFFDHVRGIAKYRVAQ